MKTLIPYRFATAGLLVVLSVIIVFHGLVLSGIIPFDLVWGGRLKTASDMRTFETISIALNGLMVAVVLAHAEIWKVPVSRKVTSTALWAMAGLFLLNTVGNALSLNELEKMLFTPLTLLLGLFSLRLALGNGPSKRELSPQPRQITL